MVQAWPRLHVLGVRRKSARGCEADGERTCIAFNQPRRFAHSHEQWWTAGTWGPSTPPGKGAGMCSYVAMCSYVWFGNGCSRSSKAWVERSRHMGRTLPQGYSGMCANWGQTGLVAVGWLVCQYCAWALCCTCGM